MELRRGKMNQRHYYKKMVPGEYSDHVINMNKLEDRTLRLNIQQLNKEEQTTVNVLTREITRLRREYEESQSKMDKIKREKQEEHENSIRKMIDETKDKKEDLDVLGIYNTSKYLAFYNLSAAAKPKPKLKRENTRISSKNRNLINSKARVIHSSYEKSSHANVTNSRASVNDTVSRQARSFKSYKENDVNKRNSSFEANSISSCESDSFTSLITLDTLQPLNLLVSQTNIEKVSDKYRQSNKQQSNSKFLTYADEKLQHQNIISTTSMSTNENCIDAVYTINQRRRLSSSAPVHSSSRQLIYDNNNANINHSSSTKQFTEK